MPTRSRPSSNLNRFSAIFVLWKPDRRSWSSSARFTKTSRRRIPSSGFVVAISVALVDRVKDVSHGHRVKLEVEQQEEIGVRISRVIGVTKALCPVSAGVCCFWKVAFLSCLRSRQVSSYILAVLAIGNVVVGLLPVLTPFDYEYRLSSPTEFCTPHIPSIILIFDSMGNLFYS